MENITLNTNNPHTNDNQDFVKLSFWQRILGIIVSPTQTMQNLEAKPRLLFPFMASGFGLLLLYLARFPLYQDFLRQSIEMAMSQNGQQLPPEQMEYSLKMGTMFGLIFTPVGAIIGWLIVTAILFGIIKLFKGKGSFKQIMSVTGYSFVVTLLYYVLSAAVSFFSGELMLNTSAAILVPDMKGSYVYGVLRGLDVFSIWYYAVIGIGVLVVSKLNKPKVYSIMTVFYIAAILIGAYGMKNM